jgi:hypothetical protein
MPDLAILIALNPCVEFITYDLKRGRLAYFRKDQDHEVRWRNVERLPQLVVRGTIKNTSDINQHAQVLGQPR